MHEIEDWAVAGQCTCRRQYLPASRSSGSTSSSSSPTSSAGARASHIPSWPCLSVITSLRGGRQTASPRPTDFCPSTHRQKISSLWWAPGGTQRCIPCPGSPWPSRRPSVFAVARAADRSPPAPPAPPSYHHRTQTRPCRLPRADGAPPTMSAASS